MVKSILQKCSKNQRTKRTRKCNHSWTMWTMWNIKEIMNTFLNSLANTSVRNCSHWFMRSLWERRIRIVSSKIMISMISTTNSKTMMRMIQMVKQTMRMTMILQTLALLTISISSKESSVSEKRSSKSSRSGNSLRGLVHTMFTLNLRSNSQSRYAIMSLAWMRLSVSKLLLWRKISWRLLERRNLPSKL